MLPTLKKSYLAADRANAWPVSVEGMNLSQQQVRDLIVETDDSIKQLRTRTDRTQPINRKIEGKLDAVQLALKDIAQKRVIVAQRLDDVKLQRDLNDVEDLKKSVDTVLHTALSIDTSTVDKVTSDDVLDLQGSGHGNTTRFDDIMRE